MTTIYFTALDLFSHIYERFYNLFMSNQFLVCFNNTI